MRAAVLGLRERKKQQTRQLIASTALTLFGERGFDHVTVAEVARAADVSTATVFNYFGTKEGLIYSGMEAFEGALLDAVRGRAPGQSTFDAFREFVVQPRGLLAEDDAGAGEELATVARVIAGSATLQARERELVDEATLVLAGLIAAETGERPGDIRPWLVANALMGVQRALKEYVHRQVLDGVRGPRLMEAVLAQGEQALAVFEQGLPGYLSAAK